MRLVLAPAWRRAAALALLVLAGLALHAALVRPLVEAHRRLDARAAQAAAQAARYGEASARRAGYERALEAQRRSLAESPHYLAGRNATLAAAQLQGLVKRAVEAGEGELVSLQVLGPQAAGELVVRARARADMRALQRLLHALESGSPLLVVDNLFIDATLGREEAGAPARMLVTFDVAGALRERAP